MDPRWGEALMWRLLVALWVAAAAPAALIAFVVWLHMPAKKETP